MPDVPFFSLAVVPERNRVRLVATGEVDIATAPALDAQLDDLLDVGWEDVVADLRQVTFMDSSGVSVLVGAHQRFADRGARFSILDGTAPVAQVLALTGLGDVLRHAQP